MSTTTHKLTYEKWLNLPETKQRYEIVDGVICMPPSPTAGHQRIQQRINVPLTMFVGDRGIGEVLTAPLDILVQREPLRTRQPDILYLSKVRSLGDQFEDVQRMTYLELAPDLAIEILSPSNTMSYMDRKLEDYQRIGVSECWLFDPVARTAAIVDLTGDVPRAAANFGVDEKFRSGLLPGFQLDLREVFK